MMSSLQVRYDATNDDVITLETDGAEPRVDVHRSHWWQVRGGDGRGWKWCYGDGDLRGQDRSA